MRWLNSLTADSSSRISSCDASGLRYVSSSLFNISGFVMGFTKSLSFDGESVRSPTSPLDFGLFSLCNPFSVRCTRSSSKCRDEKQWDHSGVGLGIVNSLVDEAKEEDGSLDIPHRKNIIFGPEVKADLIKFSMKSNSVPKNYVISPHTETRKSEMGVINLGAFSGNKRLTSGSETLASIVTSVSESNILPSSSLANEKFCLNSKSLLTNRGLKDGSPMEIRPNSVPMPIVCSQEFAAGSLSARNIELSEDYTCIISHGPNPKTTHIFCDCVLECNSNELSVFSNKDHLLESISTPTKTSAFLGRSTPHSSDKVMSFCYSCSKKLEEGTDIYLYSEKAFCSFECRTEEIMAEEELDNADISCSASSSDLNYNEDLFRMGLPII